MGLDDVDESGDGGMGKFSQDVDFPLQVLYLVGLVDPLLLVDLDGYFLVGALIESHPDCPVGSFPQLSEDLVVVHLFLGPDRDDEVEQLAGGAILNRLFLLLGGVLHLLHLELADVVGRKLVLHEVVHQLHVHLLRPLVLLFQRLLRTLGIGGRAVADLPDDLPRGRVALPALLQLGQHVIIGAVVIALGVDGPLGGTVLPLAGSFAEEEVVLAGRGVGFVLLLLVGKVVL